MDSRLLPNRDMSTTVAGERLSPPARPPLTQFHSCNLRHQVELRRPDVSVGSRESLESPVHHREMVGDQSLGRDVVLVDPKVVLARAKDSEGLTGREPLKLRHHDLDDEA